MCFAASNYNYPLQGIVQLKAFRNNCPVNRYSKADLHANFNHIYINGLNLMKLQMNVRKRNSIFSSTNQKYTHIRYKATEEEANLFGQGRALCCIEYNFVGSR